MSWTVVGSDRFSRLSPYANPFVPAFPVSVLLPAGALTEIEGQLSEQKEIPLTNPVQDFLPSLVSEQLGSAHNTTRSPADLMGRVVQEKSPEPSLRRRPEDLMGSVARKKSPEPSLRRRPEDLMGSIARKKSPEPSLRRRPEDLMGSIARKKSPEPSLRRRPEDLMGSVARKKSLEPSLRRLPPTPEYTSSGPSSPVYSVVSPTGLSVSGFSSLPTSLNVSVEDSSSEALPTSTWRSKFIPFLTGVKAPAIELVEKGRVSNNTTPFSPNPEALTQSKEAKFRLPCISTLFPTIRVAGRLVSFPFGGFSCQPEVSALKRESIDSLPSDGSVLSLEGKIQHWAARVMETFKTSHSFQPSKDSLNGLVEYYWKHMRPDSAFGLLEEPLRFPSGFLTQAIFAEIQNLDSTLSDDDADFLWNRIMVCESVAFRGIPTLKTILTSSSGAFAQQAIENVLSKMEQFNGSGIDLSHFFTRMEVIKRLQEVAKEQG